MNVLRLLFFGLLVKKLDSSKIASIYNKYSNGLTHRFESLDDALKEKFGYAFDEDEINNGHQIVIVASEMDFGAAIDHGADQRSMPVVGTPLAQKWPL
jgi:hypothetical protein